MTTTYRRMQPDEEHAVLSLWSEVFDIPYEQERGRFVSDPQRFDHTFVAVAPNGGVLSTAHYFNSLRRDADGAPRLVGHVDPVATRPDAQRQGHAARLLELTIEAMRQDGCDWSLLISSLAGRPLYTRYGWRAYPVRYRRGAFAEVRPAMAGEFDVQRYDPATAATGWGALAQVYAVYNASRPLTVVRDDAYWSTYIAPRISYRGESERLRILAATPRADPRDVCGYALAQFFDVGALVSELAVRPDTPAAIPALLDAVRTEAADRGLKYGEVDLPREPAIDSAVGALFGVTLHLSDPNPNIMARPIGRAFRDDQLDAIFAAPDGFYSGIDHF